MKKYNLLIAVIGIVFLSLSLNSCKRNSITDGLKLPEVEYSHAVAMVVSEVTSGYVSRLDDIRIRFIQPIDFISPGEKAHNGLLEIKPNVKGELEWENAKTLVFRPDKPLDSRVEYEAKLNLQKIVSNPDDEEQDLEPMIFRFFVKGNELSTFDAELLLKDKTDPTKLFYKGKVDFTEEIDIIDVEKGISLKMGGQAVKLNWVKSGTSGHYEFSSDFITRDNYSKELKFEVAKKTFDLEENFVKKMEIPALEEVKVVELKKEETGKHPKLKIRFSDQLDPEQNIDGLISVSPGVKVNVKKLGNLVILDGDFEYGANYNITVAKSLRSRWATTMPAEYSTTVEFADIEPQVEFATDGYILPSGNNQTLQFYTANLQRVHIEVKKVFDKDLDGFVKYQKMQSLKDRKDNFSPSYNRKMGVIVYNNTLEIGKKKNKWLLNEINLSELTEQESNGLFLVRLNFNPRDMLAKPEDENSHLEFVFENGQIYKPIFFSDIGLSVKQTEYDLMVYATDLNTTKPLSGVSVVSYSRYGSNRESSGTTNSEGIARLSGRYASIIKAEYNGQMSLIKLNETEWNTSGFDVSGIDPDEETMRAFIYTERGVYRPGDDINLSVILRNQNNTFPNFHPVTIRLQNPEGKTVYEAKNKDGIKGFYNFPLTTNMEDPTGNWNAEINAGSKTFNHIIKVETVVPNKLKVNINPPKEKISWTDKTMEIGLNSTYLFGVPSSNMSYKFEVEIKNRPVYFPKYERFSFSNDFVEFRETSKVLSEAALDAEGNAKINWNIPEHSDAPSGLTVRFIGTVFEGGRPNKKYKSIPFDPYPYYVGVETPKQGSRYVRAGSGMQIPVILVDTEGKPVAGKNIKYKVYKSDRYWWYEYNNQREYQLRFKTDNNTSMVHEGELLSGEKPVIIDYTPQEGGSYLVEIQDGNLNGHRTSLYFRAYYWGSAAGEDKNAGTLALKSDKEKYNVGEKAKISFPAPEEGNILFTVERGDQIISSEWYKPKLEENEMTIEIPITQDMVPTSYISVSVIQPHAQTVNDRPIRMFGILPLNIEDPNSRHEVEITMPYQLEPQQDFSVVVQTKDRKASQFTIAVVDEGLLDLTNFRTPDPWSKFFQKLRLGVKTYDIFSHIIGANKGDVFKTFSIGGGAEFRESQLQPDNEKKRFKPVCLFEGPVLTDNQGRAVVNFRMPNYVGSVRVMVVSARDNSYAHAEKTVKVKSDLMVLSTIPRKLAPGDEFKVPVKVFALKDNMGNVNVSINAEGPIEILGNNSQQMSFTKEEDKDCTFKVKVKQETGQGKIVLKASNGQITSENVVDISVVPSSPRIFETEYKIVQPGQSVVYTIPDKGIKGSNYAEINLLNIPDFNMGSRLNWLIRYPYGCIEQTTSSVFPQLQLKTFVSDEGRDAEIDNNINAGIARLRKFQLGNGGFSYWPGNTSVSEWGTNYAGHFIVEANRLGYHVPDEMMSSWKSYAKGKTRFDKKGLMMRVYRVFVLSLAEERMVTQLNQLKENHLSKMNNVEKWLLAASYKLNGIDNVAESIVDNLQTEVSVSEEMSITYGSRERDMALVLYALTILEKDDLAFSVAKQLTENMKSQRWYSTQTIAYSLLSLGEYYGPQIPDGEDAKIKGTYTIAGSQPVAFESEKSLNYVLNNSFGKTIEVKIDKETNIPKVYTNLSWSGIPLHSTVTNFSKNLKVNVTWHDENGNIFSPLSIQQGSTFWALFEVSNVSGISQKEEIALVQVLPSGWEIDNTRLNAETMPSWMPSGTLNREEYLDIRDDRIMWFFDFYNINKLHFAVKITAVTEGSFELPGTIVEAMYDNTYKASIAGKKVKVVK